MIEIVSAQSGEALEQVIALSQEYVAWMAGEIRARYAEFDMNTFTSEHDYDDVRKKFPGEHVPPDGCLLLALHDGAACGCVAVGRFAGDICEMRTLFVRPAFRGLGVGRLLVEDALREARDMGYKTVWLDTLVFMASAQGLYHVMGFRDIPPYRDLSGGLSQYICFMERDLGD